MATPRLRAPLTAQAAFLALVGTATLGLAACGGSSGSPAYGTSSSSSSAAGSASSGNANAGITIAAASVPGLGTVLVNGSGMTLYMLTSEQGGKITCTDDNGCTKVWPDTELPKGTAAAIAGSGIDTSKLSTVKDAAGSLYVTYAGWPLYTFSGDSGPGSGKGEGINSFGGTWYALSVAGTPVTSSTGSSGSSSSSSSYGGY